MSAKFARIKCFKNSWTRINTAVGTCELYFSQAGEYRIAAAASIAAIGDNWIAVNGIQWNSGGPDVDDIIWVMAVNETRTVSAYGDNLVPGVTGDGTNVKVPKGFNPGCNDGYTATGGANRSLGVAFHRKFPFQFQRFRVIQNLYYCNGTSETLFPYDIKIQHAFGVGARAGYTALAKRPFVANVDGKNYLDYKAKAWDPNLGIKAYDTIDLGELTDTIDCWTLQVVGSDIVTPNNHLFGTSIPLENLIDHKAGSFGAASADLIASNAIQTLDTITAAAATVNGSGFVLGPLMFLIEVPGTTECVMFIGDSHLVGFNAGQGAHLVLGTEYGSSMGDANLNVSWIDKGLALLNTGYCKFAKGGDGDKFWKTPDNWKYRRQAMGLVNPTRIGDEDATNTVTSAVSSATFTASAAVVEGEAYRHVALAKTYLCTKAGNISAGFGEFIAGDALGTVVNSGTASFICMGAWSAAMMGATHALGDQMIFSKQYKALYPGLPYIRCSLLPQPTTTDSFATLPLQTAEPTLGAGATSKRGYYITLLISATGKSILGYDYLWRPELLIENDAANFDGKVKVDDGTILYKYQFAGHNTSFGHTTCAPAVTAVSVGQ